MHPLYFSRIEREKKFGNHEQSRIIQFFKNPEFDSLLCGVFARKETPELSDETSPHELYVFIKVPQQCVSFLQNWPVFFYKFSAAAGKIQNIQILKK